MASSKIPDSPHVDRPTVRPPLLPRNSPYISPRPILSVKLPYLLIHVTSDPPGLFFRAAEEVTVITISLLWRISTFFNPAAGVISSVRDDDDKVPLPCSQKCHGFRTAISYARLVRREGKAIRAYLSQFEQYVNEVAQRSAQLGGDDQSARSASSFVLKPSGCGLVSAVASSRTLRSTTTCPKTNCASILSPCRPSRKIPLHFCFRCSREVQHPHQ